MPTCKQAMLLALVVMGVLAMLLSARYAASIAVSDIYNQLSSDDVVTLESSPHSAKRSRIPSYFQRLAIVEVAYEVKDTAQYGHAISSVECYAKVKGYHFRVVNDSEYASECRHKDGFFRRHCVVAKYMEDSKNLDYVLFIDSDIGVVNPKKRIEDFIDPLADIIFFDRFYNWEVMAGSYLVKNTQWSRDFLRGYADFEYRLPKSFHGTDNGAIHAYLAEFIVPTAGVDLAICLWIYNNSKGYDDLFAYEACIRDLLGTGSSFGKIKILPKGTAWARDNWMTNSKWSDERDFMMHNWKLKQLRTYSTNPLPLVSASNSEWYNPFAGPIVLSLCTRRNTTWRYDKNLLATRQEIDDRLLSFSRAVDEERARAMSRVRERRRLWLATNKWNETDFKLYL